MVCLFAGDFCFARDVLQMGDIIDLECVDCMWRELGS